MPKPSIIHYAPDSTMGDLSHEQCQRYRLWALRELIQAFPGYSWSVMNLAKGTNAWTNDEARREEIEDFCARLWDRCPWDWETP